MNCNCGKQVTALKTVGGFCIGAIEDDGRPICQLSKHSYLTIGDVKIALGKLIRTRSNEDVRDLPMNECKRLHPGRKFKCI